MSRYTITPRPALLDVVITIEGGPTLHVSQPGVRGAALTAEAERIAALLDGRAEAVIAVARSCTICEYEGSPIVQAPCCVCGPCRLARALAALDGES